MGFLFCFIQITSAQIVALYENYPYISNQNSLFTDILNTISSDLNYSFKFQLFLNENSASDCVASQKCLLTLNTNSILPLSYPVFFDSLVVLSKPNKRFYLSDIYWQFIVLIISLWLPVLVVFSHYFYCFEKSSSYNEGIFAAMFSAVFFTDIKKPFSYIWAGFSYFFLSFVLTIILVDLVSIINAGDSHEVAISDLYHSCSSISLSNFTLTTAKKCVDGVADSTFPFGVIRKLELINFDSINLKTQELKGSTQLFQLALSKDSEIDFDPILKKYWKFGLISQVHSKYSRPFPSSQNFSLFFSGFSYYIAGVCFLFLFFSLVLISSFKILKKTKEKIENSQSSRNFLNKKPHTSLSLENYEASKSEEQKWVESAGRENEGSSRKSESLEMEFSPVRKVGISSSLERDL